MYYSVFKKRDNWTSGWVQQNNKQNKAKKSNQILPNQRQKSYLNSYLKLGDKEINKKHVSPPLQRSEGTIYNMLTNNR